MLPRDTHGPCKQECLEPYEDRCEIVQVVEITAAAGSAKSTFNSIQFSNVLSLDIFEESTLSTEMKNHSPI